VREEGGEARGEVAGGDEGQGCGEDFLDHLLNVIGKGVISNGKEEIQGGFLRQFKCYHGLKEN
jgi:hypothetical protein